MRKGTNPPPPPEERIVRDCMVSPAPPPPPAIKPPPNSAELEIVMAVAPLLDKYGREEVGAVLERISKTLLKKI